MTKKVTCDKDVTNSSEVNSVKQNNANKNKWDFLYGYKALVYLGFLTVDFPRSHSVMTLHTR